MMRGTSATAVRIVLTAALAAGGFAATAVTAQAAVASPAAPTAGALPFKPSDCRTSIERVVGGWGGAVCYRGGGEHRAKVRCDVPWGFDYDAYSPWGPNGQLVGASCSTDSTPKTVTIETRVQT